MWTKTETLAEAITWAQGLDGRDLKWMLLLVAEDSPVLSSVRHKAIVNEAISRMGL